MILFLIPLLFLSCGYKPAVEYQEKILGDNIHPKVEIDIKNPRETIFLKDALSDAIYTLLGKNVCYNNCDSELIINPSYSNFEVLDYDENGYPILYRSKVVLNAKLISKEVRNYLVTGTYDFRIESSSILTDEAKLNAYKNASINALNKLFALIAKDGAMK